MKRAIQVMQRAAKLGGLSLRENAVRDNNIKTITHVDPSAIGGKPPRFTQSASRVAHSRALTARNFAKNKSSDTNLVQKWKEIHKYDILNNLPSSDKKLDTVNKAKTINSTPIATESPPARTAMVTLTKAEKLSMTARNCAPKVVRKRLKGCDPPVTVAKNDVKLSAEKFRKIEEMRNLKTQSFESTITQKDKKVSEAPEELRKTQSESALPRMLSPWYGYRKFKRLVQSMTNMRCKTPRQTIEYEKLMNPDKLSMKSKQTI